MTRARTASPGPWSEARGVSVRGLDYRVRIAGRAAATPVVLLHGFAGSSRDWDGVAAALLREGHASIAVDLPGHGETGAPADPWRYGAHEASRDLVEIVRGMGPDSAHWVGYSMGGRLALYLALSHPDRVASLVLESASPGIEDPREREARRVGDESLAREIEARGIGWFVDQWAARPLFESQRNLPAGVREAERSRRLANRPQGLAGSLRGLGQGVQPWLGDHLGAIARPTLLLTGALDEKDTAHAAWMAFALPDAEHVITPEAGHNVHLEQPEAYTRALLAHLARTQRGAPGPASWTH